MNGDLPPVDVPTLADSWLTGLGAVWAIMHRSDRAGDATYHSVHIGQGPCVKAGHVDVSSDRFGWGWVCRSVPSQHHFACESVGGRTIHSCVEL